MGTIRKPRFVVGKIGAAKFRRRWFFTLRGAERFIAYVVFLTDEAGVKNGDYYIDGPCGRGKKHA